MDVGTIVKNQFLKQWTMSFDPTCTQSHMSLKGLDTVVSLSQEGTHKFKMLQWYWLNAIYQVNSAVVRIVKDSEKHNYRGASIKD